MTPTYLPNGTWQQNVVVSLQWQKDKELYDQMQNVNKALITIMKKQLDPKIRANLTGMFTGTPERTFEVFFNRVFQKYGRPTPHDLTANDERMRTPWDPNDDIADLLRQIKEGSIFAYFIGHGKVDRDLVTIGEKAILDTGLFATQYQNWKHCPEDQRTWTDFGDFWQTEYDLWQETSRTALATEATSKTRTSQRQNKPTSRA